MIVASLHPTGFPVILLDHNLLATETTANTAPTIPVLIVPMPTSLSDKPAI